MSKMKLDKEEQDMLESADTASGGLFNREHVIARHVQTAKPPMASHKRVAGSGATERVTREGHR